MHYPLKCAKLSGVLKKLLSACALSLFLTRAGVAEPRLDLERLLRNGSVRIEQQDGTPLLRYRDSEHFIPASILKVATAYCALEEMGANYRYETTFLADDHNTLFIKGSGDPTLISETLEHIALQLAQRLSRIDAIVIDTSLFADNIIIDGASRSLNPYDAKNAAFVGNFSSANVHHTKKGDVLSAEPQTPLTPLARQAGLRLGRGISERINLSNDWTVGVQYGGELLVEFLRRRGVRGQMSIRRGPVSSNSVEVLRHSSPDSLREIIKAMLKYSTNFTANQIFLTLGIHRFGAPATVEKGQRAMRDCLTSKIGWQDFYVEEGSGLSRKNQVSTYDITRLLRQFEAHSALLPEKEGFLAKTGSLRGVNSLAGYFSLQATDEPVRFSIIINSDVPHLYKFQVAETLRAYLNTKQATPTP